MANKLKTTQEKRLEQYKKESINPWVAFAIVLGCFILGSIIENL